MPRYTDAVVNLCEEPYDEQELRSSSGTTLVVHSKAPFFSPEEAAVRAFFWQRVAAFPNPVGVGTFLHMLRLSLFTKPCRASELQCVLCVPTRPPPLPPRLIISSLTTPCRHHTRLM